MLLTLSLAAITRVQESRVLETARQMLGEPAELWLLPQLNGEPRIQKPPLAYWLAAVAYQVGGVSEAVGRVPFALCGVATLALVFIATRQFFGELAAICGTLALFGSYLFFRFMRLAETDAPAAMCVTAAMLALWRAVDAERHDSGRGSIPWFHAAAAACALAALFKGGPAVFPLLFLLGVAAVERRWRVLLRFLASGAPLTFVLIAAPWFVYVWMHGEFPVLLSEMRNNLRGGNHGGSALEYIPGFLVGAAPWSPLAVVAIVAAARRWRSDPSLRRMLLWMLAIAVPLCLTGNKQEHYLLPLMPPTMMLVGWFTAAVMVPRYLGARTAITGIAVGAALVSVFVALVMPRLAGVTTRDVVAEICRKLGPGPYAFFGPTPSPTISFYLRQELRATDTPEEACQAARDIPGVMLIAVSTERRPVDPPPDFEQILRIERSEEQAIEVYRHVLPVESAHPGGGKITDGQVHH